jgi:hypothetical protein
MQMKAPKRVLDRQAKRALTPVSYQGLGTKLAAYLNGEWPLPGEKTRYSRPTPSELKRAAKIVELIAEGDRRLWDLWVDPRKSWAKMELLSPIYRELAQAVGKHHWTAIPALLPLADGSERVALSFGRPFDRILWSHRGPTPDENKTSIFPWVVHWIRILIERGGFYRLHRCDQCSKWFYAERQDKSYCSRRCQEKHRRSTPESKEKWAIYQRKHNEDLARQSGRQYKPREKRRKYR